MSNKKDLTRIEDLGEFIHELNAEDELSSESEFASDVSDLPDLPSAEEESSFSTDFSSEESTDFSFGTTEETPTTFESEDPFSSENSDFSFNEETTPDFTSEEPKEEVENTFDASTDEVSFATSFDEPEVKEEPEIKEEVSFDEPLIADEAPKETYVPTPMPEFKAPENFEDLKKFSESSSFTGMATEGNPSFSVLVKNVRYIEDVNDIISLLKELNLMSDSEEMMKGRLMRGTLLVPRISEYAAIFLAHKLRRFDIDIQVGLSDEIHPPKHQEAPETGIVSKFNLYQNQSHHFHFDDPKLELSQIIVAATPTLEGHQVLRYLGVASEHKMLEGHVVEDETSSEVPRHYQELAQKLKAHALKANANAVVGLNYQLTPIPSEFGIGGHKYRLTCTGNLVWVNKL